MQASFAVGSGAAVGRLQIPTFVMRHLERSYDTLLVPVLFMDKCMVPAKSQIAIRLGLLPGQRCHNIFKTALLVLRLFWDTHLFTFSCSLQNGILMGMCLFRTPTVALGWRRRHSTTMRLVCTQSSGGHSEGRLSFPGEFTMVYVCAVFAALKHRQPFLGSAPGKACSLLVLRHSCP